MYVDLACGRCDSGLTLESEDESATWMLINRFANAHNECGFMTRTFSEFNDESIQKRVVKKPKRVEPTEED
jgi:hypothetical protein